MNNIIFITSHNSPNECLTLDLLNKLGYTGDYKIVIDDEDNYIETYKTKYENNLIIFSKRDFMAITDVAYRQDEKPKACVVYARNAIEDYCIKNNISTFCVADDDIKDISYKIMNYEHKSVKIEHLNYGDINSVISCYFDFAINSNIACLGFGKDNFYFGGFKDLANGNAVKRRSVSNFFLRNRKYEINWCMPMEDFSTAIKYGGYGCFFFTAPQVKITVKPQYTQKNSDKTSKNGMIDFYANTNAFTRTFYSIMIRPDCIKAALCKDKIVPKMNKDKAYPMIISNKFSKY